MAPSSNREIIDCLNSKGTSINPKRQGDSTEFFERLVEEVAHETRNGAGWRGRADVKELLRANIICTVACKECGHGDIVDYTHTTVHLEHAQASQADTAISKKAHDSPATEGNDSDVYGVLPGNSLGKYL